MQNQVSPIPELILFPLYLHWVLEGFWETTAVWKDISFHYFVILFYDMVDHMVKVKSKNSLCLRTSLLLTQKWLPQVFFWSHDPLRFLFVRMVIFYFLV